MPGYSVLSSRYAHSLLELANEKNVADDVQKDMESLSKAYHEEPEIRNFLKSPVINVKTKKAAIEKAFSSSLSKLSILFLEKLCDARREMFIDEIAEAYVDAIKKQKGILTARVTTAVKLNKELHEEVVKVIRNNAEFLKAKEIEIEERIDKDIIGGIIISVGDKQVDASFSRKIEEYKMAFSQNLYIKDY